MRTETVVEDKRVKMATALPHRFTREEISEFQRVFEAFSKTVLVQKNGSKDRDE